MRKLTVTLDKASIKIKSIFIEPMLGTVPRTDVYAQHIMTKAKEITPEISEEIKTAPQTIEGIEDKGWTGFHRDKDGSFFIYNYMIKGAIKSSIETLQENGAIKKIVAYKKWVDRMIDVKPRRIFFTPDKKEAEVLERPLRTMTPKGERVTVVRSDIIDIGTEIEYEVTLLNNNKNLTIGVIEQALAHMSLGQWRGSGGYGKVESYITE